MTEEEKLLRDIATLRESIKLYSAELMRLPRDKVPGTIEAIDWCANELANLKAQLQATPVGPKLPSTEPPAMTSFLSGVGSRSDRKRDR